MHVPRLPPRVPARARPLQGLSSVHPDAAQACAASACSRCPVNHRPRRFGQSKYGIGNRAARRLRGPPRRALDEGSRCSATRWRRTWAATAERPAMKVLAGRARPLGREAPARAGRAGGGGVGGRPLGGAAGLRGAGRAWPRPRGRRLPAGPAARGRGGRGHARRQPPRARRRSACAPARHCFVEKPLALTVDRGPARSPRSSRRPGASCRSATSSASTPSPTRCGSALDAGGPRPRALRHRPLRGLQAPAHRRRA